MCYDFINDVLDTQLYYKKYVYYFIEQHEANCIAYNDCIAIKSKSQKQ